MVQVFNELQVGGRAGNFRIAASIGVLLTMCLASACSGADPDSSTMTDSPDPAPSTTTAAPTASPTPSTSTTPAPTTDNLPDYSTPTPGTTLTALEAEGRWRLATSGHGYSLVQALVDISVDPSRDLSVAISFDAHGNELMSLASEQFTADCHAADILVDGRRTLLTEQIVYKPAAGIEPATYSIQLDAWDVEGGGERLWFVEVVPPVDYILTCSIYSDTVNGFASTENRLWGLYEGRAIVDLRTGNVRRSVDELQVLGNYLLRGDQILDPATLEVVGNLPQNSDFYEPAIAYDGEAFYSTSTEGVQQFVSAYSLPDGAELWRVARNTPNPHLISTAAGILLVDGSELLALDESTGDQIYTLPESGVCGTSATRMLVAVNGQVALIELLTGSQISYADGDCPPVYPGGITFETTSDSVMVSQVLS